MKFSVFILRGRGAPDPAKLLFFATRAEQAEDPNRPFALSAEDFARLNPNTRTCPVFRTRHDADLTRAIYQRIPILWRENPEENPWRIRFAPSLTWRTTPTSFARGQSWKHRALPG
jgi:hypothetical protein